MKIKPFPLQAIQKEIRQLKQCDGWLLFDFHGHNTLALELLNIPPSQMLSRRFFYWIPKSGTPVKIVHEIEENALDHLPGTKSTYADWQSLELRLIQVLDGKKEVAMEHSSQGKIPTISKLDSGTYEWLENKKIKISCSWPIAQHFISRLDKAQFASHKKASLMLIKAYKSAWNEVKKALSKRKTLSEYNIQQHILEIFAKEGYTTDHPPVIAVDANAALPHYFPTESEASLITPGSLLLIDLWAKNEAPRSVFADITQVAYVGKKAPEAIQKLYDIVWNAQASVISYIERRLIQKKSVRGSDIDDVCRAFIQQSGYGMYFVHRTGHNISHDLHGLGPNLDNFETNDTRELLPRTCYSVEPGIYIPHKLGLRLECNIFIHNDFSLEVTGHSSKELPCLL